MVTRKARGDVGGCEWCVSSSCGMRWVRTRWECMVLWGGWSNIEKGHEVALRNAGQKRVSFVVWSSALTRDILIVNIDKVKKSAPACYHIFLCKPGLAEQSTTPSLFQFAIHGLKSHMIRLLFYNQLERLATQQTHLPNELPCSLVWKWRNQTGIIKRHFCNSLSGFPRDWRSFCTWAIPETKNLMEASYYLP